MANNDNEPRPSLDRLIAEAAKLPPGHPKALAPIFKHYPELSVEDLAEKFEQAALREREAARELREYSAKRPAD